MTPEVNFEAFNEEAIEFAQNLVEIIREHKLPPTLLVGALVGATDAVIAEIGDREAEAHVIEGFNRGLLAGLKGRFPDA